MAKVSEILQAIYDVAPQNLQEDYDNIGLMLGSAESEVRGIVTCLDCTAEVVAKAIKCGANLIVAHHPLIFRALKSIDASEGKGGVVIECIRHGISVIAAHTNYDKAEHGLCYEVANMLCGYNVEVKSDICGALFDVEATTLGKFAASVSRVLDDKTVRFVGDKDKNISKIFLCTGGGGSDAELYDFAKSNADVFVSGDFKHHNYIDAREDGFALVEFSHYASEIVAERTLKAMLQTRFEDLKIENSEQPCPFGTLEDL